MKQLFTVFIFLCATSGCGGSGSSNSRDGPTRAYFLGFTPFPYAISTQAIDFSYAEIAENADLVAHHLEEGIPWDELDLGLGLDSFPAELREGWTQRKIKSPPGHKRYVAITPISLMRDAIAPRPVSSGSGLPAWLTGFNLARTKDAYLRYCIEAIEFFNPDYLVIGIEVNELIHNQPGLWDGYLELQRDTYDGLKALYPGLSISVSLTGMNLIQGYTDATSSTDRFNAQLRALTQVMDYSDLYCLSLHTFISALLTDTVISSADLAQIFSLSGKPLAICETSYPAQTFSVDTLTWNSDTAKQNRYFENLFSAADEHAAEFMVNFVIRDYDDLWISMGSPNDLNKLWKDTGFYDENGLARPVLSSWQRQLNLNRR